MPDALGLEDSAAFAERLIDRWMREHVMLAQADAQLKEERSNLDAALEAYRKEPADQHLRNPLRGKPA